VHVLPGVADVAAHFADVIPLGGEIPCGTVSVTNTRDLWGSREDGCGRGTDDAATLTTAFECTHECWPAEGEAKKERGEKGRGRGGGKGKN